MKKSSGLGPRLSNRLEIRLRLNSNGGCIRGSNIFLSDFFMDWRTLSPQAAIKRINGSVLTKRAQKLQVKLLDWIYPPNCLACDSPVAKADGLCGECWQQLRLISKPYCPVLGIPFAADMGSDIISAQAIASPPPFARARSAVLYDDLARSLVSQFKYADRLEVAKVLARLMVHAGEEFWQEKCVLVPVPLHWQRRITRKYNQSQLLADEVARLVGAHVAEGWVKRVKSTRHQVGLSSKEREHNVRGAFRVTDRFLEQYQGELIIFIDDVVTTGATIEAMTRSFGSQYRSRINVLSFARVVSDPIGAI